MYHKHSQDASANKVPLIEYFLSNKSYKSLEAVSEIINIPYYHIDEITPNETVFNEIMKPLNIKFWSDHNIIPLKEMDSHIVCVTTNPFCFKTKNILEDKIKKGIFFVIGYASDISRQIQSLFLTQADTLPMDQKMLSTLNKHSKKSVYDQILLTLSNAISNDFESIAYEKRDNSYELVMNSKHDHKFLSINSEVAILMIEKIKHLGNIKSYKDSKEQVGWINCKIDNQRVIRLQIISQESSPDLLIKILKEAPVSPSPEPLPPFEDFINDDFFTLNDVDLNLEIISQRGGDISKDDEWFFKLMTTLELELLKQEINKNLPISAVTCEMSDYVVEFYKILNSQRIISSKDNFNAFMLRIAITSISAMKWVQSNEKVNDLNQESLINTSTGIFGMETISMIKKKFTLKK